MNWDALFLHADFVHDSLSLVDLWSDSEFGGYTVSADEREPITEVWGQSPQRGAGAEPLLMGSSWKHFCICTTIIFVLSRFVDNY